MGTSLPKCVSFYLVQWFDGLCCDSFPLSSSETSADDSQRHTHRHKTNVTFQRICARETDTKRKRNTQRVLANPNSCTGLPAPQGRAITNCHRQTCSYFHAAVVGHILHSCNKSQQQDPGLCLTNIYILILIVKFPLTCNFIRKL